MSSSFTHLHVHTEYSMLDGAARIGDLVAAAAADGQPAIGITDHGNMYGVLDFYKACRKEGVKPIIGTEAYMAGEHRSERPSRRGKMDDSGGDTEGGNKLYYHLTLLAENDIGYKNLIQVSSRAFMEGYYYKPRVDWEVLEQHSEGLIATTGCLGGHVLQSLMHGDEQGALEKAARLQDIFGRDNLFIELQDHGIPEQIRTNPQLIEIAKKIKAPLLATNDSHYVHRHDAVSHDALLCVQTGSLLSDQDRFKFHGDDHYLKSATEMRHLFREVEVSCDNTLWIAERCDVEIEFGNPLLPNFPLPEGFDNDDAYLEFLTFEGAKKRWGDKLPDEVVERLAFELQIIRDMGFSSYFLITWDLIKHARDLGIRVGPGRGSAAGCAVAYTLWITDLDPIKYDLLFERFLNPSRISMPDIDMDFDSRYRDEMIRYCAERYGRDHVAQIVTFSQIKARAAVRDAARVLGYPYAVGDKVAKAMPPLIMGRDTPLAACFVEEKKYESGYKMAGELREMYESDPDVKRVVDVAKGLEGMRRSDGIHAAAVVVTKNPLTDYLPIQRKPEAGTPIEEAPVVTQYEMNGVEELGLLKLDFLGLRNLDVITDALALIKTARGIDLDIDNVDLEDEETYNLLARGDSIGVFQLESTPMRALMRSLAPNTFQDVAALVALYRPGPMAANMHNDYADRKNARQEVSYIHPDAQEILEDTYGLMIYQESVMRMAQKFAGYSLAQADNLRKACGKKIREMMVKEKAGFVDGVEQTGYGRELGEEMFAIIEQFADYAFNKSHSYGYGFIAYQIAYLKAHYPVEYLAALLTSVKGSLDKAAIYLNECRVIGIDVVVPDINTARMDFHPVPVLAGGLTSVDSAGGEAGLATAHPEAADNDDDGYAINQDEGGTEDGLGRIIFGLSAVRNVGEGLVERLLAERDENGPFADFYDFCQRVDSEVLNKRAVESLIQAGSFDAMGYSRQGLLTVSAEIIDYTLARRKEHDMGVMSLFGEAEDGPVFDERATIPDMEFDKSVKLRREKEMLGLYISDHPLLGFEGVVRRKSDGSVSETLELEDGTRVKVGGVITNLQKKWTRKGDLMAVFELEDLEASIEVMVFPRTMQEHGHKLVDDAIVIVGARTNGNDDVPNLFAQTIDVLDTSELSESRPLRLRVNPNGLESDTIDRLRDLLRAHPGESSVYLHLGNQVLQLPGDIAVDTQGGLVAELRVLLGPDSVIRERPPEEPPRMAYG